jgi:hypothetical protein
VGGQTFSVLQVGSITNQGFQLCRVKVKTTARLEPVKPLKLRVQMPKMKGVVGTQVVTLVGIQNGIQVCRQVMVNPVESGWLKKFDFPTYTPTMTGNIQWIANIAVVGTPTPITGTAITTVTSE